MARSVSTRSRSSKRRRSQVHLHKPNGVIDRRVQAVGPERFGIVSVDCAKHRSRWMLCDFYGRVLLLPPGAMARIEGGMRWVAGSERRENAWHRRPERVIVTFDDVRGEVERWPRGW